jgi:hemolysin III
MRNGTAAHEHSFAEEIAHAATHGLGLILSLAGCAAMSVVAWGGDGRQVIGAAVFGATLVLLYAASTLYHAFPVGPAKEVFRRMDHAAIFLLIAGSYTPFTLVTLRGDWGFGLLATVWALAVLGIVLATALPRRTRRFSVVLCLGMGWLAAIAAEPLSRALPAQAIALLVAGGAAYTLGVVFYAWRRPFNHVVWHVFVLAGSACHFACVLGYVIQ